MQSTQARSKRESARGSLSSAAYQNGLVPLSLFSTTCSLSENPWLAGWQLSLSLLGLPLVQPPPPRHMPPNTKVGLLIKTEGSVQRVHKSGARERERAKSCWCEGAEILINALTYVSLCNINNDLATHLPRAAHCKPTIQSLYGKLCSAQNSLWLVENWAERKPMEMHSTDQVFKQKLKSALFQRCFILQFLTLCQIFLLLSSKF